jgi:hypothetical protein
MAPNESEALRERGKALEDEFFRREDKRLIARLQELKAAEANRDALARASGITKPEVLDPLLALGIRAETLAALSLVPLVEVAWADGTLDAAERRAVLEHAQAAGITSGSTAAALLDAWLERRPERALEDAWARLAQAIGEQAGPETAAHLKQEIVQRARAVARASGGVLGLGSKVSKAEAAALQRLEAAFTRTP